MYVYVWMDGWMYVCTVCMCVYMYVYVWMDGWM
jgi:hypothetical protein